MFHYFFVDPIFEISTIIIKIFHKEKILKSLSLQITTGASKLRTFYIKIINITDNDIIVILKE